MQLTVLCLLPHPQPLCRSCPAVVADAAALRWTTNVWITSSDYRGRQMKPQRRGGRSMDGWMARRRSSSCCQLPRYPTTELVLAIDCAQEDGEAMYKIAVI